jgi:hypothetical protein
VEGKANRGGRAQRRGRAGRPCRARGCRGAGVGRRCRAPARRQRRSLGHRAPARGKPATTSLCCAALRFLTLEHSPGLAAGAGGGGGKQRRGSRVGFGSSDTNGGASASIGVQPAGRREEANKGTWTETE